MEVKMGGYGTKAAPLADLSVSEDGSVVAAFAVLGDPNNQRVEDIDKDGEVSVVGSLPAGKTVPLSAYAHASWPERGGRLPVGVGVISEETMGDRTYGVFRGRFFLGSTAGRDTYEVVRGLGPVQEWSFGFRAVESESGTWAGQPATINRRYDVYEVAPVLIGAANGTRTLAVKEDEGSRAGLSLADHIDRVFGEVVGVSEEMGRLRERVEDVATMRRKEGRTLSAANRERISRLAEALRTVEDARKEIERLLAETDPERIAEEAKAIELAYLRNRARILGLLAS